MVQKDDRPLRKTYELEDWELMLILRLRQLRRDGFQGLVHVDLVGRAIVGKVDTRLERLEVAQAPARPDGARV